MNGKLPFSVLLGVGVVMLLGIGCDGTVTPETGDTVVIDVDAGEHAEVDLTLQGLSPEIEAGSSMEVSATASVTVTKYAWYVNGSPVGEADAVISAGDSIPSVIVGEDLAIGWHTLVLMIGTDNLQYSREARFRVIPAGTSE